MEDTNKRLFKVLEVTNYDLAVALSYESDLPSDLMLSILLKIPTDKLLDLYYSSISVAKDLYVEICPNRYYSTNDHGFICILCGEEWEEIDEEHIQSDHTGFLETFPEYKAVDVFVPIIPDYKEIFPLNSFVKETKEVQESLELETEDNKDCEINWSDPEFSVTEITKFGTVLARSNKYIRQETCANKKIGIHVGNEIVYGEVIGWEDLIDKNPLAFEVWIQLDRGKELTTEKIVLDLGVRRGCPVKILDSSINFKVKKSFPVCPESLHRLDTNNENRDFFKDLI